MLLRHDGFQEKAVRFYTDVLVKGRHWPLVWLFEEIGESDARVEDGHSRRITA